MTEALTLTQQLGGRWHHGYGVAPCPVCQPDGRRGQNALTLSDSSNGLLLHCKKADCDFRDILTAAGVVSGNYSAPDPAIAAHREAQQRENKARRAAQAEKLWTYSQTIEGSLAESYLRARGITCALPDTLRFNPACWHRATETRYPAMIALVEGGESFAVHRTYLKPDGTGKADIAPAKAMLGAVGGGMVKLSQADNASFAIAEGIETALSLCSGLLKAPATVFAALSATGMASAILPPIPGKLIVATDGDSTGKKAGYELAARANGLGWDVSTLPAPDNRDWNDILTRKGAAYGTR